MDEELRKSYEFVLESTQKQIAQKTKEIEDLQNCSKILKQMQKEHEPKIPRIPQMVKYLTKTQYPLEKLNKLMNKYIMIGWHVDVKETPCSNKLTFTYVGM